MDANSVAIEESSEFGAWRAVVSYCLSGFCLSVFVATILFLTAVVTTRKFTYNLYIVFLLLPDAFLNLMLGIRSLYDGLGNTNPNIPEWICRFQQVGIAFYISNLFVNAVVAKYIYDLVWNSFRRKRTTPPTIRKIVCQAAIIYFLVGLFATWQVLPVPWAAETIVADPYCNSVANLPLWAFAIVFCVIIIPPVVYCVWVFNRIIWGGLLPLTGRTRVLAMYFMRIIGLFIFFYVPMTCVLLAYRNTSPQNYHTSKYFWLQSVFTLMNPIQNIASLIVFSQKDDIQHSLGGLFRRSSVWQEVSQFTTNFSSSMRRASMRRGGGSSTAANASSIAAAALAVQKTTKKSGWEEDDIYEKQDDSGAVVRRVHYQENREAIRDMTSEGGVMSMWMSMDFTENTLSAPFKNSKTEACLVERRSSWAGSASEVIIQPPPQSRRISWPLVQPNPDDHQDVTEIVNSSDFSENLDTIA